MAVDEQAIRDNLNINFGETAMNTNIIKIAQEIDAALNQGKQVKELTEQFDIKRALLYKYQYLVSIRQDVLQRFIDGKVGLVPLVDLHKKFGNSIAIAIDHVSEQRVIKNRSPKATFKEVSAFLESPQSVEDSTRSASQNNQFPQHALDFESNIPLPTYEARGAINRIRQIIHEASQVSQLANGLYMDESDVKSIQRQLGQLEQWLDDLNPEEAGHQGDPLDQSTGSYVFDNMIDHDQSHSQYSIEDENQDIYGGLPC